jgi:hypothetical protein
MDGHDKLQVVYPQYFEDNDQPPSFPEATGNGSYEMVGGSDVQSDQNPDCDLPDEYAGTGGDGLRRVLVERQINVSFTLIELSGIEFTDVGR